MYLAETARPSSALSLSARVEVEDEATALLMRRFYENLFGRYEGLRAGYRAKGMPKAIALREAKQWLRTYRGPNGTRPYAHPFFWSAFVLIGDPD